MNRNILFKSMEAIDEDLLEKYGMTAEDIVAAALEIAN